MTSATFTGGLRVGSSYWEALDLSWPLADLSVFDDQLVITGLLVGKIVLKREELLAVREYRRVISDGIQIQHSSKNQQPFIVFWISPNKVAPAIRQFGFKLQPMSDKGKTERMRSRFSISRFIIFIITFFVIVLTFELLKKSDVPDAVLNAVGFTIFIALVGGILRARVVR
jgi:hypothetical protein